MGWQSGNPVVGNTHFRIPAWIRGKSASSFDVKFRDERVQGIGIKDWGLGLLDGEALELVLPRRLQDPRS